MEGQDANRICASKLLKRKRRKKIHLRASQIPHQNNATTRRIREAARCAEKRPPLNYPIALGGVVAMARQLGVAVIAEGVETEAELATLEAAGIHLFQGFLFARPALAALPPVRWPARDPVVRRSGAPVADRVADLAL